MIDIGRTDNKLKAQQPVARAIAVVQVILNTFYVIWASFLIGQAQPVGSKYEGGWFFGLAWFPIILFAAIQASNISRQPKRWLVMLFSFISPYVFIGFNIWRGTEQSVSAAVLQMAILTFTATMVAFALYGTIFPLIYKTAGKLSEFFQGQALPIVFGSLIGLAVSWYAFHFLLSIGRIETGDLPLIFLGILQGGITTGLALYKSSQEN